MLSYISDQKWRKNIHFAFFTKFESKSFIHILGEVCLLICLCKWIADLWIFQTFLCRVQPCLKQLKTYFEFLVRIPICKYGPKCYCTCFTVPLNNSLQLIAQWQGIFQSCRSSSLKSSEFVNCFLLNNAILKPCWDLCEPKIQEENF